MRNKFKTANDVFNYYYPIVCSDGVDFAGTKALFNVGFTIQNPSDRRIDAPFRNFKLDYAEAEWQWYLSGDPNVDKLGEIYGIVPHVWQRMVDYKNEVRSNYGWQWERNHQLDKVVQLLRERPETRQATISIYDGKEIDTYRRDTPCTYAITFTIVDRLLDMAVLMRSNDLWFGFCNDQFCFSKLQEMVAERVGVDVGTYYHHATNFHVYNNKLNKHL